MNKSVERPIAEHYSMVTQGYELVNIESQSVVDQNTLYADSANRKL